MDLLSRYRPEVRDRALEMMAHWSKTIPTIDWLFGRPEERGIRISDLDRAAGVLYYEGGPLPEHSTYAMFFTDDSGGTLRGANGTYVLTMTAPPVFAFWSVTVYDTERGGYLYPNPLNRYAINNTGAVRNADGTYTFVFKHACTEGDKNCIPVPSGEFDIAGRFYWPRPELLQGKWQMSKPTRER